ncbi:hypothetical protein BCU83_05700 [Vibrio breoganii]|uniref:AttH domain-containing protein n=1 Tax=Vibrio breoganii TaxID=553239 RepID=A0AAN1CRX0_9VIBR|nr:lipocalin-like domain-containing protein [Vibrio breoganii]ANO32991.1 hypothetical protein A6E01_07140 [Vibrio breoganii]PMG83107.1 hypothetical protein BCU83_05700 [Vibrio breoganii]PMK44088.1 hypothetical protein BCU00_01305 [Vibrio breoganii]PMK75958.1 hypothetical protein BCT94_08210 [Vibrio breoganii]PML11859.1 hypothetical protein BCT84_16265 [Vibrio breoganii]
MQITFNKRLLLIITILVTLSIGAGIVIYKLWSAEQQPLLTIEDLESEVDDTFEPVLPGPRINFPNDFRIHPKFQHEVWRYIAMLNDDQGNEYLVQWFLFRISMSEDEGTGWESPQIYTSQAIVTTPDQVFRDQRFARGGIGLVGMRQRPYQLSIDNWTLRSFSGFPMPGRLSISSDQFDINLANSLDTPYIPLGESGYQVTHELMSRALYGYAAPYVKSSGTLTIGNQAIEVSGMAVFNQVWGTDIIGEDQKGYNQFMFRLQDGRVLSVTKTRHHGDIDAYHYGNIYTPDGGHVALKHDDIEIHAIGSSTLSNGKTLPLQWVVNVPEYNIFLTAKTSRLEQWANLSIPSWSGRIEASGSINASGYLQLIGY